MVRHKGNLDDGRNNSVRWVQKKVGRYPNRRCTSSLLGSVWPLVRFVSVVRHKGSLDDADTFREGVQKTIG